MENQAARSLEVEAILDGLDAALNSLAPGMTIVIRSPPGHEDVRVWLNGNTIIATSGSLLLSRNLAWKSHLFVVESGRTYLAYVTRGELAIVEKGLN